MNQDREICKLTKLTNQTNIKKLILEGTIMLDLYSKRNERKVSVLYPTRKKDGTRSNVLRKIDGIKIRSYTGPNGRGAVIQENNGQIRSLSNSRCVEP